MPAEPELTVGDGDPDLDARSSEELTRCNVPAADAGPQCELTVQVRDDAGGLVGGLSGWTGGTCAGVAVLWVRDDSAAPDGAAACSRPRSARRQRGCTQVVLSSFTFQARDSYRRQGCVETGRTEGLRGRRGG